MQWCDSAGNDAALQSCSGGIGSAITFSIAVEALGIMIDIIINNIVNSTHTISICSIGIAMSSNGISIISSIVTTVFLSSGITIISSTAIIIIIITIDQEMSGTEQGSLKLMYLDSGSIDHYKVQCRHCEAQMNKSTVISHMTNSHGFAKAEVHIFVLFRCKPGTA